MPSFNAAFNGYHDAKQRELQVPHKKQSAKWIMALQ